MLPQRLRGPGRAIFRAVSPRASLGGEAGGSGGSVWESVSLPSLRRKASNTWSAVQDTFLSTKEIFEKHRVVFTVGTSVASVLTAWAGYSLRQLHQSKLEKRLESIEQTVWSWLAQWSLVCKQEVPERAAEIDGSDQALQMAIAEKTLCNIQKDSNHK
ncbi:hypothetical protein ACMD2_15150 [Ananas comosus]|uniref:Uncharacterized protein n=1 Tax=Ananas comosus TaxID=4615 RepID=A0A199VJU6_ANACO|nr:hypothetical protein ACMD2_15150 [Ananas comosus]